MTDTIRTVAALQNLLRDGQAPGSITPQIIRDMLVSLDNEVSVLSASTATLIELENRVLLPSSIAATSTVYIGSTNFPFRIGGVTLSFSTSFALDATNYWLFELWRIRNGIAASVVTQNTYNPTGLAITANVGWNYDNSNTWVDQQRYLLKGDVLKLVMTKVGAPAALTDGAVALRYEPYVLSPYPTFYPYHALTQVASKKPRRRMGKATLIAYPAANNTHGRLTVVSR